MRALHVAFAAHLDRPAVRLAKSDVVAVLDALSRAGRHAIAGRTAAYGRACFAWAQKRDLLAGNPFERLPVGTGIIARDRVLADAEVGALWLATGTMPYPFGPAFRLLLLSLARLSEVTGARWREFSADLSTWTIPSERMKRGQPHVLVLPEPARALLGSLPRRAGSDYLFTTTGATPASGISKAKAALDARMRATAPGEARGGDSARPWRLHDLRRTGVSTLARLGFSPVVADLLLAHQPSALSTVARVYQRHDFAEQRALALRAWADHVLRCAEGTAAAPVADLAQERARRHGTE